MNQSRKELDED